MNTAVTIPCPLCASEHSVLFHHIQREQHPDNRLCMSCGMLFVSPRISEKEYLDYYTKAYAQEVYKTGGEDAQRQIVDWRTNSSKKKLALFPDAFPRNANVFEIGAGSGSFLQQMKLQFDATVQGIEPSDELRAIAQQAYGITLDAGTIETYMRSNAGVQFDVVIMDQVLEHLYHPLATLQWCKALLKKDGILYLGVPNAANPAHPLDEFFIPEHIMTYTPWTILLMLWRAGFKITHLATPERSPLHVLATPIENAKHEMLPLSCVGQPLSREEVKQCFKKYHNA